MLHFVIRAVPGKKVLGVERNLEMGVPPTQFYLFYGTVHMDIPGNTPTHLILIDFHPPRCPLSWNSPKCITLGIVHQVFKWHNLCVKENNIFSQCCGKIGPIPKDKKHILLSIQIKRIPKCYV